MIAIPGALALRNRSDIFKIYRDPDLLEQKANLQNCVCLVLAAHLLAIAIFLKLKEFEPTPIITDNNISLILIAPPIEASPKTLSDLPPSGVTKKNPSASSAPFAPKSSMAQSLHGTPVPKHPPKIAPVPPAHKVNPAATNPTTTFQGPEPEKSPLVASMQLPPLKIAGPATTPSTGQSTTENTTEEGKRDSQYTGPLTRGMEQGAGLNVAAAGSQSAGGPNAVNTNDVLASMGNIAPYRKDMLTRLAKRWHPAAHSIDIVVLLEIASNGKLLATQITRSSGDLQEDNKAVAAARATRFSPLPNWYRRPSLIFQVELARTEASP